jgi:preprotein translocase SecE subunit
MAKTTKKESAQPDKAAKSKKESKKKGSEPAKEQVSWLLQLIQFLKESWGEFRKVQWPTPRKAINQSIVVLITVVMMILLVNLYDFISGFLLGFIL